MSWSEKLKTLTVETARQGAEKLSRSSASAGQLGKLLRRWAPEDDSAHQPPPARYEPKAPAADSDGVYTPRSADLGETRATPARPSPVAATNAGPHADGWRSGGTAAVALALKHQPVHAAAGPLQVPDFVAGDLIAGVCQVEKVLHRGPLFVVYRARHLPWDIPVAVKVPAAATLAQADLLEQVTTSALEWIALGLHPHVTYCHYVQHIDGVPALVLEHVDGGDLRSWISGGRAANLRLGLNLAIQICHGLEHLHAAGVRHGALVPAHVLVGGDGMVKIGNLGPRFAETAPSDSYRAPELWVETPERDVGADVFALGVLLYEMFCGHRPYEIARGPRREPSPPRFLHAGEPVPERLGRLLAACVDWERERRPVVEEARAELCAAHEEMFARPSPFAELPAASWAADGLNNQALAAMLLGDESGADDAWDNALQNQPLHPLATYNLATVRWRRGEITDQAVVRHLERARSAMPDDWVGAHCLALVHLERGETTEALALLEEASALAPSSAEVHETLARLRADGPRDTTPSRHLRGHSGFVSGTGIGDGGRTVYSTGDDGTLRVWDAASGRLLRTLEAHGRRVSSLALSADGAVALSGGEEACLKVWDLQSGRCLKTIGTGGAVFCAALSADGSRAAAASSGSDNFLGIDNTQLRVWDLAKDRKLGTLVGHTSAAKAIALSADGQMAVTGGDDHTVRVWDVTGTCKRVMDGHLHYVSCVLFCPDGEHVLSGSWDQTMRLWNIKTGRCVRVFGKTGAIVTSIAITSDGRLAVSGCWDGAVRFWDLTTGRCLRTIPCHARMVTGVAVDGTGTTAASSSWDGTVCVHPLAVRVDRSFCLPQLSRPPAYARLPSAEPDAEELVESAERALADGKPAVALDRIRRARDCASDSPPPGLKAIWRALSSRCRRTHLREARGAETWFHSGRVDTFLPLADTSLVLIAGEHGLHLWEVDSNRRLRTLEGHAARVVALASGDGGALSASADGSLRWWDLASGTSRLTLASHESVVAAACVGAGTPRAVSGSYDHTVRVWDLDDGRCLRILRGHRRQVTAVCANADASVCASGDYAGTILLWSEDASPIALSGHEGCVTGMCFVGEGERILSSSADGTLRLWGLDGACLRVLEGHAAPVTSLDCSADGRWGLSSASDGSLRLWDLHGESGRVLADAAGNGGRAVFVDDACAVLVADGRGLQTIELEWELQGED